MKIIISLSLLFAFASIQAQDSTNINSGLITKNVIWPSYRLNGKKLSIKKLETEIFKVPAAIPYYQKAKTSKTIGYSFVAPTVLFTFLGKQNRIITNHGYGNNKVGFQIAGILSSGAIIFFLARSMKNLKKAAAIHNKKLRTIY